MRNLVAITGATGFIGREVVARLIERKWPVRALARRHSPDLERAGVVVIPGSLEDDAALQRLVTGAAAVVHCAGAVQAPSAAAYRMVNGIGSAKVMAAAAATTPPPRFLLLSSLAAREPALSAYAESKWCGERKVRNGASHGVELCIVRPPAVYGPRDRATLPIFRQLRKGLLFIPAVMDARFSLIYVSDLAETIVSLLETSRWGGCTVELDDGREGGYRWQDLAEIAGRQLGRAIRTVAVSRQLLWPAAMVTEAVGVALRRPPRLSPGKLRELFHPDWVCRASAVQPLAQGLPRTTFEVGFPQTLKWYEENRWL